MYYYLAMSRAIGEAQNREGKLASTKGSVTLLSCGECRKAEKERSGFELSPARGKRRRSEADSSLARLFPLLPALAEFLPQAAQQLHCHLICDLSHTDTPFRIFYHYTTCQLNLPDRKRSQKNRAEPVFIPPFFMYNKDSRIETQFSQTRREGFHEIDVYRGGPRGDGELPLGGGRGHKISGGLRHGAGNQCV